jgi:hypothetical protein
MLPLSMIRDLARTVFKHTHMSDKSTTGAAPQETLDQKSSNIKAQNLFILIQQVTNYRPWVRMLITNNIPHSTFHKDHQGYGSASLVSLVGRVSAL